MVEFARFYMSLLKMLFENIGKLLKAIWAIFKSLFYDDPKAYFKLFFDASSSNQSWNALDWIALILVAAINLAFVTFVLLFIYQLLRRYFKFTKREIEKDELIEEIAILNQKTLELIDEKNKILSMKVSQIGLSPLENPEEDEYKISTTTAKGVVCYIESRFEKLTSVDLEYQDQILTTEMSQADQIQLSQLIDRFIGFSANQLKLYYNRKTVGLFFAGMATSKVIILEGISGTGKTSLPYALGKFFQNDAAIVSVQPSWRDRAELLGYLNEFTKKFNETDFLKALYTASYREDLNFIVLDEMNLARIEYYFAEFLSVMEMPDVNEWKIDLVPAPQPYDPKRLINGKVLVPQNVWFVGTANRDDSTFTITDKVYDRAIAIHINDKAEYVDAPEINPISMSYEYLDVLFKKAIETNPVSQKTLENFGKLDKFIQDKFKISFGNRILKQIRLFVPVFVACGNTEYEGMDYMLVSKILRKFETLNLTFLKTEIDQLVQLIDKTFGKNVFKMSIEYLRDLQKMY